MPFGSMFQSFIDKAEQKVNQQVQSRFPSAPPIPNFSKPRAQSSAAYWQPQFRPEEPVSTHFLHQLGHGKEGWGNLEKQNYVDRNNNSFHGSDNTLVLRAIINRSLKGEDEQFTSARLNSHQTLARPRGSLSARITGPVGRGVWPAFWLLPSGDYSWPKDGEIDIFEAWHGDATNHSCLHWGFFNGEDYDKHRVVETPIHSINSNHGVRFDFAWDEDESSGQGRMIWYIDSKPVMKAFKPPGTRKMSDFCIIINIAVGGRVCQEQVGDDGTYEMVVRELAMWEEPPGGWRRFEDDFRSTREGHTN